MNRLNRTISYLFCINILLCAFASRLVPLIEPVFSFKYLSYFMKYMVPFSLWVTFVLSSFSLFLKSPKLLAGIACVFGAILLHSFSHLYWPSMRFGVPVQDFLLSDTVSANYSFAAANMYLKNVLVFLLPSLVFLQGMDEAEPKVLKCAGWTLLIILVVSTAIAMIQGLWNIHFLALGSGTAPYSNRATGLLEDGGASAVYFALLASGFLSVFLFARFGAKFRALCAFFLILAILAGVMSAGRAFFVSFLLSALCLFCLYLFHFRKLKSFAFALSVVFASVWILKFSPPSLSRSFAHFRTFEISRLASADYLHELLTRIDPVRSVHIKAMFKTFLEHPWKGTGLGSFYANLFEHQTWAVSHGGFVFADPPEFYPMILSEWGLAGILILLLLGVCVFRKIFSVLRKYNATHAEAAGRATPVIPSEILDYFILGLVLSLLFSFWIGIHLIFLSVSSLAGLSCAWILLQERTKGERFYTGAKASIFVFASLLVLGSGYQWWTAPRAPAFRWQAQGRPQVPLSLPLGAGNVIEEKGLWLSSGEELLLRQETLSLVVKRPAHLYPVEVKTVLYDQDGKQRFVYIRSLDKAANVEKGDLLTWHFEKEFIASCNERITPDHFCSFRIFTDPKWKVKEHKVGVYVLASSLGNAL